VRYSQTVLGVLWVVIRPLLTMLIFTWLFGRLAKMPFEGAAPYSVMVLAGILPWQFFANSLSESSNSLIANERLVSKVYFPRMIIPASAVLTNFVDFLFSLFILAALFVYYGYMPPVQIAFLPLFAICLLIASMGPALWLTAVMVKFRDFRHLIPFILQVGIFISPVGYSSSVIPAEWKWAYSLNPLVGVIDGFRWCIVRGAHNPLLSQSFYISLSIAILFFYLAILQFRKMEKTFADVI